jgi:hypothetical protein
MLLLFSPLWGSDDLLPDPAQAIQQPILELKERLSLTPPLPHNSVNRINRHLAKDNPSSALEAIEETLSTFPNALEVWVAKMFCLAHLDQGDHQDVIFKMASYMLMMATANQYTVFRGFACYFLAISLPQDKNERWELLEWVGAISEADRHLNILVAYTRVLWAPTSAHKKALQTAYSQFYVRQRQTSHDQRARRHGRKERYAKDGMQSIRLPFHLLNDFKNARKPRSLSVSPVPEGGVSSPETSPSFNPGRNQFSVLSPKKGIRI